MSGSVTTYYVSPAYEVTGSTVTKYIYLNGQRIAMERGSTVTYLHTDRGPFGRGSTVAESSGTTVTTNQSYCAYGRKRTTAGGNTNCSSSNSLLTDHTFTGQKYDSSGLQFFNARYYDPQIGTFISPDTIVPEPSLVIDYYRYVYARGNALRFADPSGHDPQCDVGTSECDAEWSLWREYLQYQDEFSSFEDYKFAQRSYNQYLANPNLYYHDYLVRTKHLAGTDQDIQRLVAADNYGWYVYGATNPPFYDSQFPFVINADPSFAQEFADATAQSVTVAALIVPNPNGKNGGLAHQAEINRIKQEILARNNSFISEYRVNTPGGYKNVRYVDVVELDANQQPIVYYQVGEVNQNHTPVAREVRAMEDIYNNTGGPVVFRPYRYRK